MTKIAPHEHLDIVPYADGFIYARSQPLENGSIKVSFLAYDCERRSFVPVPKNVYLSRKFGSSYAEITDLLTFEHSGDFISCDTAVFANETVIVLYRTGEMYIFGPGGDVVWSGDLRYRDESVRDIAIDGKNIWCTVPDGNAVINYSPVEGRVLMRIGGGSNSAFSHPVSVTEADGTLYVCNQNSYKIRSVSLADYSVADYMLFKEPVYKYFRCDNEEFAVLESGLYLL